ncbi:GntR family transcriptional regulator [Leifsonia sp. AG29]|uniref:GntR family transcriptional regulator n=1 Tax=Leifsonia sp. AG29 TaxID=2598860 RepID=UPI00131D3684|nr:GntR family transcriptional regulator [Leifsonia sp. AG29]
MPVPSTEAVSPRRLIRDEVFIRLLDAIVEGDLTPGEQLYDAEIEKWVGVSRTPVREALNQLAAMGLVEILPQKRTRVTTIDPERLSGLIRTVGTLFSGVVRDVTPLLTDEDRAALRDLSERPELEELAGIERDRFVTENFLAVFLRRFDNRTLARLLKRHLPEVSRALVAAPSNVPFEKAAPHLRATAQAAAAGKSDKAARAMGDYWEKGLLTVAAEFAELERKDG